jgi:hypothetical protein
LPNPRPAPFIPLTPKNLRTHLALALLAGLATPSSADEAKPLRGLGVAGGIMPAIGFAVLLKIMMKNVYIPYFILGFVAAAWLQLPVLAIAAAAATVSNRNESMG